MHCVTMCTGEREEHCVLATALINHKARQVWYVSTFVVVAITQYM